MTHPQEEAAHSTGDVRWVVTTEALPWQTREGLVTQALATLPDVLVEPDKPLQTIEGFGACFNELGWTSLSALSAEQRDEIFRELFAPGAGAGFSLCRMPIGANDFSRDWYSYDEVDGDFDLGHFTIDNDLETLIPFIRSAQEHQPELRVWASPWSPPSWMKTNKHYAGALPVPMSVAGSQHVDNGLQAHQVGREGTDMFIQEESYFRAYASYFGRFVDEYRQQGIAIEMVMPQNEFNSPQVFPSCPWTSKGLARFIRHLGPEMEQRGVEVFFGTLERADDRLLEASLEDPEAVKYISGVGIQWAGKGAIPFLHRDYPDLRLYQTEQECGDGRNDWRYCRYAWSLVRHYLSNGASGYMYWNMALRRGGLSRWGWPQNSLVTVDAATGQFAFNHEYYLMKHLSHFVKPGARVLQASSFTGYENQLAFRNPDGSVVVVMHNDTREDLPVRLLIGDQVISPTLAADSFSTFVVPPSPSRND